MKHSESVGEKEDRKQGERAEMKLSSKRFQREIKRKKKQSMKEDE